MAASHVLPVLLLVAGLALPAGAQVFDVFPYEQVSAFGRNNERDVNAESCDMIEGCFDRNGNLCSDNPNERCDLATVPAGRCSAGNTNENVWPSKSGECEGTFGYFERGPFEPRYLQGVTPGGIPCVTDTYAAALAEFSADPNRDDAQVLALKTVSGPSSMCPGNGTCDMDTNDNSANCQAFDPKPSFCEDNPNVPCGVDTDCPKECVGGYNDGLPCRTALTECEAAFPNCPGQGGSDDGPCGFCVIVPAFRASIPSAKPLTPAARPGTTTSSQSAEASRLVARMAIPTSTSEASAPPSAAISSFSVAASTASRTAAGTQVRRFCLARATPSRIRRSCSAPSGTPGRVSRAPA
jgi:hypothetical protein